jgi:hypothetical protein
MTVDSQVGVGSTFSFTIPAGPSHGGPAPDYSSISSTGDSDNR